MKDVVWNKDIEIKTTALVQKILMVTQKYLGSDINVEDTNPDLIDDYIASGELDQSEHEDSIELWKEILVEYLTREIVALDRRRYYISNHGRVISIHILADGTIRVMIMKLRENEDGYKRCSLNGDGMNANIIVHRVVLIAFGPAPDGVYGSDVSKYH